MLLAMVMVLGMTVTASAAKVEDQYQDNITITNLAEGVDTTLKLYNIIYLNRDTTENESWVVVDWAIQYITLDPDKGAYTITNPNGLKEAAEKQTADKEEVESETSHTFTQLPIGAYVVLASDTAGTYGLMVTNTYDKDGVYMASKPANVAAKIEGYNTDKKANDKFVHRGETVNFTITTKFPAKTNANGDPLTKFEILDEPNGLLINGLPTVTISGEGKQITDDMITKVIENGKTKSYKIDLSSFIESSEAGATVVVEYSATVMDEDGYNNTVDVDSNTVDYTESVVEGFEGNITLTKINEDGSQKLSGAEFSVYKGTDKETALEADAIYFVKAKDGEYRRALENEEGATQTIVTGSNGTVKVTGLDEGTYWFKETKAPEGYALVNDPTSTVIEAGKEDREVSIGENGDFTFTNTKLSSLPETGGIGTTIFTIGGCAIMVAAAGLFFASRRKANK